VHRERARRRADDPGDLGRRAGPGSPGAVRPRRGGVAAPSLLAGVLLALSLPPWGWWPLAFMGAGLLYWRLRGLGLGSRVLAGWLAGLGCFVPGLLSFRTFNWYGAAVLMMAEALSMAAAGALVPPWRGRMPAFVGAFTLAEALRMNWPWGGLPIGGVFLGQAGGPLLATARVGGPLLLTALVWLGGAALGELARMQRAAGTAAPDDAGTGSRHVALGGLGLTLVLVVGALGVVAPDGGPGNGTLGGAAVQGGGPRGLSKEQVDPATVFRAQLAATARMARATGSGAPPLVLWPEDVISLPGPLRGSAAAATMSALARHLHTTLVAGVTTTTSATAFKNVIVAWGPDGRVVSVYQKVHRVPFGEYVPARSFFAHFASLDEVPLDEIPGSGTGLMRTPAGALGALDSFEVFFASRGRSSVRAGAEVLVVPTNTSSYANSQIPAQELAAARVQAVAQGRDLLQAAPTGFSAVVNAAGAVLARSDLGEQAVLLATLSLRRGHTLYVDAGDAPVLVIAAACLAAGWIVVLRRRTEGTAPRRVGTNDDASPDPEDGTPNAVASAPAPAPAPAAANSRVVST